MKPRFKGLLLAACLVALSPAAMAQDILWGAVMVGPNGAYGWAVNAITESQAEFAARANCDGACTQGFTFYNSCGAIAVGSNLAFWGYGDTQWFAEEEALDSCHDNTGYYCEIAVWACTD